MILWEEIIHDDELCDMESELGKVFGFIRHKDNREELLGYIKDNEDGYSNVKMETVNLIVKLSGSGRILDMIEPQESAGGINMCKALEDMVEEAKEDGKIEGKIEGISAGKVEADDSIINKLNLSESEECDIVGISVEEYKEIKGNLMNDNPKLLPGYLKKSFEMAYRGGMIWFEHLDGIYNNTDLVIEKFERDALSFCRPSVSGMICIVLDETVLDDLIIDNIYDKLVNSKKNILKVCFVGVDKHNANKLKKLLCNKGMEIAFIDDLEKAKQWLIPKDI